MSADTETIREALEAAAAMDAEWYDREHSDALAALGRVEERERALAEAREGLRLRLAEIRTTESRATFNDGYFGGIVTAIDAIDAAALSSAAGSGEQMMESHSSIPAGGGEE